MGSSTFKVIGYLFVACLMVQAQNAAQKTNPSSISGKVTVKGNGVAGITVGVRPTQSDSARVTVLVTTDQQGNYRIPNISPGQYQILPAAPQFVLKGEAPAKTVIVNEGENLENVDFTLVRGGVITGKVTDADGRPMIEEPADGSFKVHGLRPGVVEFSVWGRRQGPMVSYDITEIERDGVVQPNVEIKPGEQVKGLRLVVKARTGTVRGVVKYENGQIQSSRVYGILKKVGETSGVEVRPDDRGRFMSEPLAAGVYELDFFAYPLNARATSAKQQVVVADNQATEVVVTLELKAGSGQGRP
jgi:hypothetical protein